MPPSRFCDVAATLLLLLLALALEVVTGAN
uniref:Uncharacterized protein n=1 Tax=Arundo donax TaxID=35708 RepID=A0A0A9CQK1_ARUDO